VNGSTRIVVTPYCGARGESPSCGRGCQHRSRRHAGSGDARELGWTSAIWWRPQKSKSDRNQAFGHECSHSVRLMARCRVEPAGGAFAAAGGVVTCLQQQYQPITTSPLAASKLPMCHRIRCLQQRRGAPTQIWGIDAPSRPLSRGLSAFPSRS